MASNTKIDHAMANARELLKTFQAIKNEFANVEVRDPQSKILYPIAPFLKMTYLYVQRTSEMVTRSLGRSAWKIDHLLTTSRYFVQEAGFPEGKLPSDV